MHVILSSVKLQSALVYLHDIAIFPKNANMHISHLQQVLALLQNAGVLFRLKQCSSLAEKTNYPGHLIRLGRPELFKATAEAIRKLKDLTASIELGSFVSFCSLFRLFVPKFLSAAAPLHKKLKKRAIPRHSSQFVSQKQTQWKTSRHY